LIGQDALAMAARKPFVGKATFLILDKSLQGNVLDCDFCAALIDR